MNDATLVFSGLIALISLVSFYQGYRAGLKKGLTVRLIERSKPSSD